MSEGNIVTFLTDIERTLVIALLEERREKLLATLRRTDNIGKMESLQYLVKTTATLRDKLQHASTIDHSVRSPLA